MKKETNSLSEANTKKWEFWCDRGGTFTDIIGINPQGEKVYKKLLSNDPKNYTDSTVEGIRKILNISRTERLPTELVGKIKIGTTIGTNALLELKGEPIVLVTTMGFKDALRIGYQNRPDLFALKIRPKRILFKEIIEVDERINSNGEILSSIDVNALSQKLKVTREKGITSAAVVFMHSYLNPSNELLVEKIAKKVGFEHISLSHKVAKTVRFVSRGETTCVDAYLTPILRAYISKLSKRLPEVPIEFMQSHGGLVSAHLFSGKNSVLSGPAGGVVGTARTAEKNTRKSVIGFDMGGTSTDVCHYDGQYERQFENEVNGVKLNIPMMAIETVAAGGGSVVDFDGVNMRVGPESAGSNPGPACYKKGGPLTVTDCNVLLGKIRPGYFPKTFGVDNKQEIDTAEVIKKFESLTKAINDSSDTDMSSEDVAEGFIHIAVSKMADAIRKISTQKGIDLSNYVLNCFGGAAGQHACQVADALGISTILIDENASLLSAVGVGCAKISEIKEETINIQFSEKALQRTRTRLLEVKKQLSEKLLKQGIAEENQETLISFRLKYEGTDDSLEVTLASYREMNSQFEKKYNERYGFLEKDSAIIIASVLVETIGQENKEDESFPVELRTEPKTIGEHKVFFGGQEEIIPFYSDETIQAGNKPITGPIVVINNTNTIVVERAWSIRKTKECCFILERDLEKNVQSPNSYDTIQIELFSNQLMTIADQMGIVFQKTSRSVNIKERLDLSCAVFDENGCLLANAPHIPVHLGSMSESVKNIIKEFSTKMNPGDVYATNDPFKGGTHLPDVTVITPLFVDNQKKPLFFLGSRGHHADIGGITPGSMPANSTRIEQEGVLLENIKIVSKGKFQEQLIRSRLLNHQHPSRNIDNNIADLRASVAANKKGSDQLLALASDYGLEQVRKYTEKLKEQGEKAIIHLIKSLDSGSYQKTLDSGEKIHARILVNKSELSITVDFCGTSKQTENNLNAPIAITQASILYVLRTLVEKEIPLNEGCLRRVKIKVPTDCFLNPRPPAAVVAGNVETSQNIVDCLYGALDKMASSQGTMNNLTFGNEKYQYYETICGGTGAGSDFDGCDAVHSHMTNSRLTDPEILEIRFPVMIQDFSIRAESGGSGQYTGGNGVSRKILFLEKMQVSLLSSHRLNPPSGINGGDNGTIGSNRVIRENGKIINLKGIDQTSLDKGDILWLETPGGGGYGTPKKN